MNHETFRDRFSKTEEPDAPLIPLCCECKKVRDREGNWHEITIPDGLQDCITHTYCEQCAKRVMEAIKAKRNFS